MKKAVSQVTNGPTAVQDKDTAAAVQKVSERHHRLEMFLVVWFFCLDTLEGMEIVVGASPQVL